jgi:YHS domain-containing protein
MFLNAKSLWVVLLLALAPNTAAIAEVAKVNIDGSGVAIKGYDPVAYFEMAKPVKGSDSFRASHEGATYRFVSKRHLTLFKSDPQKYVPAYGGYCAFGMRYGQTSEVDPTAWTVVDGKLYLQYNQGTQAVWRKKPQEYITIANQLWKKLGRKN